jgi:UDP-2,4-diacetamido-2,4,6-trideoxy-beta-L-altropyranose hydrolase
MKVAFRVDAELARGGGHVYRCLALAEALAERNARCQFLTKRQSLETVPALARSGHELVVLDDIRESEERHGHSVGLRAGAVDVLIVDDRGLGESFELAAREWALLVAAIDDGPYRPHAVDLLIDHTRGRAAEAYVKVAPQAQILAGSRYALLRGQFARCREESLGWREARAGRLQKILVAFGATDQENYSGAVLDMLLQFPDLCVDVLLGASHPAMAAIRAKVAEAGTRATLRVSREDVAQLMADADLAIGAAGGMSWERCTLGVPAIVAIIADDQREVARSLTRAGAAICLGEGLESLAELPATIARLREEPSRVVAMGQAAARLCDGLGAQRAADVLLHVTDASLIRRCG